MRHRDHMNEMGAVLVTMAWTRFWWRLNSRMEWNWNEQTGMAQIRSGQRGRGRKEHDWRKRWQNLRTQQHILIQSPKSCALPTPPVSAHLGRNLCCLHPLVPRTHSLHSHQQQPELKKAEMCTADLQSQPTRHTISQHTLKRQFHLQVYENAEEMWGIQKLWPAIMSGFRAHLLWHLSVYLCLYGP